MWIMSQRIMSIVLVSLTSRLAAERAIVIVMD